MSSTSVIGQPIAITGAAGFVGGNLVDFFLPLGPVIGLDLRPPPASPAASLPAPATFEALDLRDAHAVDAALRRHRPAAVIHVAGNKNVRFCQEHPAEAHAINSQATAHVAKACRAIGARLVYLSTDLVFESTRGRYTEDETPASTLVYGQTKRQGELLALAELPDAIICRSGGIYGRRSPLLHWLAAEIAAAKKVHCFTDIYNTPTYVDNLAEMIVALLQHNLPGIFHTVGSRRVNRFEFFSAFCRSFDLPADLLEPTLCAAETEKLLLRPDSSLDIRGTQARLAAAGARLTFDDPDRGFARLRQAGGF